MGYIQFYVRKKSKSCAQFKSPLIVSEKADVGFHKQIDLVLSSAAG